ncbi:hypothetical protein D3C81_2153690 [compost metagenome]
MSFKTLGNFTIPAFNRDTNQIFKVFQNNGSIIVIVRDSPTLRTDNFGALEIGNANAKPFYCP